MKDGIVGDVMKCFVGNEEEENLQSLKENTGPCPLWRFWRSPCPGISRSDHLDFCLLSQEGVPVKSGVPPEATGCQASVPEEVSILTGNPGM